MIPFKKVYSPSSALSRFLSSNWKMLFSKPGFKSVNCYTSLYRLFFHRKTAKGLQEGASGLQQMSWATSYKLEKESNPLRLIMGRGHTRSCVMSLWDGEKATASYWISRDRAWNLSCWLHAFTLQEQCLLLWGGHKPCCLGQAAELRKDTLTLFDYPPMTSLSVDVFPTESYHSRLLSVAQHAGALHLPPYLHRCKVVRKPWPKD